MRKHLFDLRVNGRICLCAGMDSTLPPPNLSVLELGPLCRVCPFGTYLCPIIKNTPLQAFQTIKNLTLKQDQSKSEVVKQYWTKRELENKIDIEEVGMLILETFTTS